MCYYVVRVCGGEDGNNENLTCSRPLLCYSSLKSNCVLDIRPPINFHIETREAQLIMQLLSVWQNPLRGGSGAGEFAYMWEKFFKKKKKKMQGDQFRNYFWGSKKQKTMMWNFSHATITWMFSHFAPHPQAGRVGDGGARIQKRA